MIAVMPTIAPASSTNNRSESRTVRLSSIARSTSPISSCVDPRGRKNGTLRTTKSKARHNFADMSQRWRMEMSWWMTNGGVLMGWTRIDSEWLVAFKLHFSGCGCQHGWVSTDNRIFLLAARMSLHAAPTQGYRCHNQTYVRPEAVLVWHLRHSQSRSQLMFIFYSLKEEVGCIVKF